MYERNHTVYDTYEDAQAASVLCTDYFEIMPYHDGYIIVSPSTFRRKVRDEAASLFDGGWRPGDDTPKELVAEAEYGEDNPAWTRWAEAINEQLQDFLDDYSPIDADSFGAECPENWEEIAEALNEIIRKTGKDPDQVWEDYCSERLSEVPEARF